MSQVSSPEFDKGFFASVPRLVRTGYKNLSAVTKWIYVCLKDLCGEVGTCYRALRTLASEIGVSTGMLSESIYALKEAGLITAEKKRRPGQSTKAVWHISIINIWKLNGEHHATGKRSHSEQSTEECSSDEQDGSQSEQSPKNVHSANNNVQHVNKVAQKRSPGEAECSQRETEEENSKHDHSEEISVEEEKDTPTSSQPDDFHSSFSDLNLISPLGSHENHSHIATDQEMPGNASALDKSCTNLDISPNISEISPQVETQHSGQNTCSSAQGYKTDDRPQSTAVEKSITAAELLAWLSILEQEETEGSVKRFAIGRLAEKPADMQRLELAVQSLDNVRGLYKVVREQALFSDGRIIWATNLAKVENIAAWQERAREQPEIERDEPMDQEQADAFAQWLMQHGFSYEVVAIDKDKYIEQWYTCLQYAPDRWLYLSGPKNYNNPTAWELECIELARLASQREQEVELPPSPDEQEPQETVPEPQESREFGMAKVVCNGLMNIIRQWSPVLKLKPHRDPELDRWTVRVHFGDLKTQYFEVENHAAWKGIKQEDAPMLECAVRYGMSLQEMAVPA